MTMTRRLKLAGAMLLAAGAAASAQSGSLTTTLQGGNSQAGAMFDLTAINEITITGFDYLSASTASPTMQEIEIYFVTDRTTFVGKENDAGLWTLMERVAVERQPEPTVTHVPIAGFTMQPGETIGIYFTRNAELATTSIRYTNGPLGAFSNDDLIFEDRGVGKAYPFGSTFDPRIWNGTIHYQLGATVETGACCFPDGSCDEVPETLCTVQGGTYHGDNTDCATTPPGGCPQPPEGACCLEDGTCIIDWETGCLNQGGIYHGDGTDCATIPPCPSSLSTTFNANSTGSADGAGSYFNLEALDSSGVVIESIDINSPASAGEPLLVHVYVRPQTFDGFESDPLEWTLLDEVSTTAAGQGNPTPVEIDPFHIPHGEKWGLRVGITGSGGMRYLSSANTDPIYANQHLELESGVFQNNFFGTSFFGTFPTSLRGFSGRIWYETGATYEVGACCMPSGACEEVRQVWCEGLGGTYHGDNTDCATTPPGGCPQPPEGACCLSDGSCIIVWEPGCLDQGGTYHGDGSDCATIPPCPKFITTTFDTTNNMSNTEGPGSYFLVHAKDPQGITIESFDINTPASAGSSVTAHVYYRPETFVGFTDDISAWTLLGEQTVTSAGQDNPTELPVGGLAIAENETYALRVGITGSGGMRYNSNATTPEYYENSQVRLYMGEAQNNFFGSTTFGTFPTNLRGWSGTMYYSLGAVVQTGACCLPDGTCQEELTQAQCGQEQGIYQGHNSECATVTCPQPGACCFEFGGCDILSEAQCEGLAGATYQGHGTECTLCPEAGACCLADGSCVIVTDDQCSTIFNGTFAGAGTNCGEARCATEPMLWNHGPLLTDEAIGCNGNDLSALQNTPEIGGSSLGFNWHQVTDSRLADQFIVPEGDEWNIDQVVLFGYDTGATTVTYTAAYVQIWDGDPRDPGSSIIAGDMTTNRLTLAEQIDLYRATVSAPTGCLRQIQRIEADLEVTLGPGTYWIDRAAVADGTPWMPPVTFSGLAGKPNATGLAFFGNEWSERIDTGNDVQQDMPFLLMGSIGTECYPNCDGSTTEPILTVDDFTCFINEFAHAQTLSVQEQIEHYANCDGSTTEPILTVDDFTCFINAFAQGCP